MALTLTISIQLGNDTMQTGWDVGKAVRRVGYAISDGREHDRLGPAGCHAIHDRSGNLVGSWYITNPNAEGA